MSATRLNQDRNAQAAQLDSLKAERLRLLARLASRQNQSRELRAERQKLKAELAVARSELDSLSKADADRRILAAAETARHAALARELNDRHTQLLQQTHEAHRSHVQLVGSNAHQELTRLRANAARGQHNENRLRRERNLARDEADRLSRTVAELQGRIQREVFPGSGS